MLPRLLVSASARLDDIYSRGFIKPWRPAFRHDATYKPRKAHARLPIAIMLMSHYCGTIA